MTTKAPIPFPTYLCITAILTTSLALYAAAAGIQWGSSLSTGDALQSSWLYVQIALALNTFLLWPGFALQPSTNRLLHWDLAALTLAAIPTTGTTAFLSNIDLPVAALTLTLQAAFALFTLGIICWAGKRPHFAGPLATLLASLAVVAPILAYIAREFFPVASRAWFAAIPVLSLHQAASPAPVLWWIAAAYLLAGILLLITAKRFQPRSTPAS
jgi:hypothetical protein